MTGVEILSIAEVAVAFGFSWVAFLLILVAFMASGALIGWACDRHNFVNGWLIGLAIFSIFGLGLGAIVGFASSEPTAYETQYKVTVSDEVPMNEFLKRYEIIDQEGNIYTIQERDDYVEPETEEPTEKTGHWTGWANAECSECGQFNVIVYSGKYLNYCPDCGIKMVPKEN